MFNTLTHHADMCMKKYKPLQDIVDDKFVYYVKLYFLSGEITNALISKGSATPKRLSQIAKIAGAVFAVCPQKYGCRQFTA